MYGAYKTLNEKLVTPSPETKSGRAPRSGPNIAALCERSACSLSLRCLLEASPKERVVLAHRESGLYPPSR
jgi:hypothetical protein